MVDCMIASPALNSLVDSFKVFEMTMISDHRPCSVQLRMQHQLLDAEKLLSDLEQVPVKYKWDLISTTLGKDFIKDQLSSDIQVKADEILRMTCEDDNDVIRMNHLVAEAYNNIASSVIPR